MKGGRDDGALSKGLIDLLALLSQRWFEMKVSRWEVVHGDPGNDGVEGSAEDRQIELLVFQFAVFPPGHDDHGVWVAGDRADPGLARGGEEASGGWNGHRQPKRRDRRDQEGRRRTGGRGVLSGGLLLDAAPRYRGDRI